MTFLHQNYPWLIPLAGAALVGLGLALHVRRSRRRRWRREKLLEEAWL